MENNTLHVQIDQLLKCLEAEMALSSQLLELGKQQQQALIDRQDERLHEITAAQDARVRQLSVTRKRSESSASTLAASLGLDPQNYTLADLAETLGDDRGHDVAETICKLVDIAGELYKQNLLNKNLLMNAVQYIGFCLKLISGADDHVGYGGASVAKPRAASLVLDQTA